MSNVSGFYSKMKNLLFALNILFTLLFLFIMAYSFSRLLRDAVNHLTGNTIIVITIYFLLFYFFYFLFVFVLRYAEGYVIENRIRQRKQKFRFWLKSLISKEIIVFVLLLIGVQVVYFFLETNVSAWWVPLALLSIITKNIGEALPNWMVPYYSRHKDLDNAQLNDRLLKLAKRAGMSFSRILVYKDSRAKATIVGFSKSKQLILSDAALGYSVEELEVMVAMEMGKMEKGYYWKKALIEAAGMFTVFFLVNFFFAPACAKFGFEFVFDVETLPVLLGLFFIVFVVIWFALNYFMQDMFKENDNYALRFSKAPDAFVSLIIRDSQANYQAGRAAYFFEKIFIEHSPVSQRVMLAQDYAQNMLFEDMHRKH